MRDIAAAALAYARRGWPVFPCHWPCFPRDPGTPPRCSCDTPDCDSIGKHPRTFHGHLDATTDEAIIHAWWTRWPRANIGLVTGAVSGLVVLDIDPRNGGDLALEDLEADHGKLPATIESLTGGGGRHLLFAHPGGELRCGTDKLGPGLDLKADGGYIIAPPSLHASRRRYLWEASSHPDDVPLAPLPAWMPLEEATAIDPETGQRRALDDYTGDRPGDEYNRRATREELRVLLIEQGARLVDHRQGVDYLCRPGKSGKSVSGTLGYLPGNRLRPFSSNWPLFPPTRGGYRPFDILTRLKYGGDFSAAAKALAAQGYGTHHTVAPPDDDAWEGMYTQPQRPSRRWRYVPPAEDPWLGRREERHGVPMAAVIGGEGGHHG